MGYNFQKGPVGGIARCFEDTAVLLHNTAEFPPPTTANIIQACGQIGLLDAEGKAINAEHVKYAEEHFPEHHAHSVRWWRMTAPSLKEGGGELDRQTLHKVCLDLDIKSSVTFRAEALALSPELSPEDRDRLCVLTKCDGTRLPESLPRRLGLAWALVLTTEAGARAPMELKEEAKQRELEAEKCELEAKERELEAKKLKLKNLIKMCAKDKAKQDFFKAHLASVTAEIAAMGESEFQTPVLAPRKSIKSGPQKPDPETKFLKDLCDLLEEASKGESGRRYLEELEGLLFVVQKATGRPVIGFEAMRAAQPVECVFFSSSGNPNLCST